jgi:competence protein ComEC
MTSLACAWLFFLLRKERQAFLFILISTFLLGASFYSLSNRNFDENSLRRLRLSNYADFYGTLYKSPSRGPDRDILFIKVKKVFYENKQEKIRGNLRITVPHSSESSSQLKLFVHDKIKVSARLLSSKGFRNFKAPSLNAYLKSQNIHNRAFSKSALLVERLESGKKYSPLHLLFLKRSS